MPSNLFPSAGLAAALLACALPLGLARAQSPSQPAPAARPASQNDEQSSPRRNQKIESIHTEDSGAAVDEVRYGGRTQSINVRPKGSMPGYEVLPPGAVPRNEGEATGPSGNGPRVWNVLKF